MKSWQATVSKNLTGNKKLDSLRNRFGNSDFVYVGNDTPDLPVMAGAAESMVANPSRKLRTKIRAQGITPSHKPLRNEAGLWRSLVKALRPHQWAKNLLILLPPLLAHNHSIRLLASALLALLLFLLHGIGNVHGQRSSRH